MNWAQRWGQVVAWPLAFFLGVIIAAAIVSDALDHRADADVRKACIEHGGTLGEHNGWPTCTYPTPGAPIRD